MKATAYDVDFALLFVGLVLGMASFFSPIPFVLSGAAVFVAAVMFVRVLHRAGGAR
jgi:hypothetical protein